MTAVTADATKIVFMGLHWEKEKNKIWAIYIRTYIYMGWWINLNARKRLAYMFSHSVSVIL